MGLTVLDAGVVIGFLEPADVHHAAARATFHEASRARDDLAVPASALAEVLAGAWREGPVAVDHVTHVLERLQVEVIALLPSTASEAGRLRARFGRALKLPDALVVAAAIDLRSDRLVTTDRRWPDPAEMGFEGEISVI